MLGILTPEQKEAKRAAEEYFETKTAAPPIKKRPIELTVFMPEKIKSIGFQEPLQVFMDAGRIRRAKDIKDREVAIQEVTDKRVKVSIREYHLLIDLQNRMVLHNCADWSRCITLKQFCKHVDKILMSIPREKAVHILRKICLEREGWEFKPYVA